MKIGKHDRDPVARYFCTANPNPDRVGCPRPEVLQAIARRSLEVPTEAFGHLAHCSNCFADVDQCRAALRKRQLRLFWVAGAAALSIVMALFWIVSDRGTWESARFSGGAVARIQVREVTISLFDEDALRGGGQAVGTIQLPPAVLRLIVTLPRLSRPGMYTISLCRVKTQETGFIRGRSVAVTDGPRQVVTVVLDLTDVRTGSYWLATRRDEEDASTYFPVKVP